MTSFQIVGTAHDTVGRCDSIRPISEAASMKRSGSTRSAPAISAAYGNPHALAWNIGTMGRAESSKPSPIPLALHTIVECR
jgi:hypothetical protein